MKWILCLIFLLSHAPAFAAAQYGKAQCDDLKNQKEIIRKRMNAGYGVQEGNWLNIGKTFLKKVLLQIKRQ